MLSKDEAKQLRIDFWGKLEKQMEKIRNPHGTKVNWLNYNTGIKQLYFRMEADEEGARLCIDLQMPDSGIRELYYQQFLEFQNILEDSFKAIEWHEQWDHWNGKQISRISFEKTNCQLQNKDDWDKMHLFLKLNLTKLDEFWCEYGEVFKNLA